MGHSAGAHLVALLTAHPAFTQAEGALPWLGTVSLDSAAFDVVAVMSGRHLALYDRAFRDGTLGLGCAITDSHREAETAKAHRG